MNRAVKHHQGAASLFVLMMGLLLVILTMSLITRQLTERQAVRSFENRLQAHYLAESGMELALWQLSQWSDQSVEAFLEGFTNDGSPSSALADHIRHEVIFNLHQINAFRHHPLQQLFSDDATPHAIKMQAEASIDEKEIVLTVQGNYGNARVAQQAIVQLPVIISGIHPEAPSDQVYVKTMVLHSRSQVLATWP